MSDYKIRVDVVEYLPSGVQIRSKLKGTQMEIDNWLRDRLNNNNRRYTIKKLKHVVKIWWE